jgi:hypothetical protein
LPWATQVVGVQPAAVLVLVLELVFVLVLSSVVVVLFVSLVELVLVLVLVLVVVPLLPLSPPVAVLVFVLLFLVLVLVLDFLAAASSWVRRGSSPLATGRAARRRITARRVLVVERVRARISKRTGSMSEPPPMMSAAAVETGRHDGAESPSSRTRGRVPGAAFYVAHNVYGDRAYRQNARSLSVDC